MCSIRFYSNQKAYGWLSDGSMERSRRTIIRIIRSHSERLIERIKRIENDLRVLHDEVSQNVIEHVHLRFGGTREQHREIVDPVPSGDFRHNAESIAADSLVVQREQNDVQKTHHRLFG